MNSKAKMMALGMAVGLGTALLIVVLVTECEISGIGFAAALLLTALAGFGGWMIGMQMRVKLERDRIWLEGYKDARQRSHPDEVRILIRPGVK